MKIAIITGGSGPERDVSIKSSEYITEKINFAETQTFLYPEEYNNFLKNNHNFDVVVPVIHGYDGEDGELQKDLKKRGIKYIFSDSQTNKQCFHKENCKKLVSSFNIKTPQSYSFKNRGNIKFPLIAKPQESGSSVGLYFIKNKEELDNFGDLDNYLYEQYIIGREFTIGVVETIDGIKTLPVMEAKTNKAVFNYDDKYSSITSEIEIFPEDISEDLEKQLKDLALRVHTKIGLRHLSRTDVIVDENDNIYFIEVNTIPGCTSVSWIPKMINREGLYFSKLLEYWCVLTIKENEY